MEYKTVLKNGPIDDEVNKLIREGYRPIGGISIVSIEGKMFHPMALTVIFALIASLILALTFIPAMATFLPKNKSENHETFIIRSLKPLYQNALQKRAIKALAKVRS